MQQFPYLGFGLGLRPEHYQDFMQKRPDVDWLEIITENFMMPGGNPRRILRLVREYYPVVMHGVSMSLGSTDPLDDNYLNQLKTLMRETEPAWVSDHLCWSSFARHSAHDLWPLPYTEEALNHLRERILYVQEFLGRRILVENVSSYVTFCASSMPEWEFLTELAKRTECGILLDINNIYVSAKNHNFDPYVYLKAIPKKYVGQFHLAGHSDKQNYLLDTHDHPICKDVWQLYQCAVEHFGMISTLIERDDHIPTVDVLEAELNVSRKLAHDILTAAANSFSPLSHSA